MRTVIKTLIVLALLGAIGAVTIVGLGLFNVSARAGHLPGVSWVLHTAYRQSVKLRAPAADMVPDLSDPDLVGLGAGHFDSACSFCHAAPDRIHSATADAMSPEPPHITDAVADWQPQHLFTIVKDGVKMSGMPFWPAENRDDEIWAVVAFLTQVREMEGAGFDAQLASNTSSQDTALTYCASCHGANGDSNGNDHIPRLDILDEGYMQGALAAYRTGARDSGFMSHAATQLPLDELTRVIRHYASARPEAPRPADTLTADQLELMERGAGIASIGTTDAPSCASCHGPGLEQMKPGFPRINGQPNQYIARQLQLWRDGTRGGGPRKELMEKAARNLTDEDITALALYYSQLPAE
tara:strand:- start:51 stop:1115 length:1065 start_codon:yes stop_codon:yes gene_type:complete